MITAQGQVDIDVSNVLTIDEALTSGGATNITVTADDVGGAGSEPFKHTAGTISSTSGALTIVADDMALGGTITATNQTVTLRSNTSADGWELGGDGTTGNELELTEAELETINAGATGIVRIGTTAASSGCGTRRGRGTGAERTATS